MSTLFFSIRGLDKWAKYIQNKNETEHKGLGINLNFESPFIHRATLYEMKGQFDWVNDTLLPIVEQWSNYLLIGLVFLLVLAFILIKLPFAFAVIVVTVGKAVIFFWTLFLNLFTGLTNLKLLSATLIMALFAMFIGTTAEDFISPEVVVEHNNALNYLRSEIAGQIIVGGIPTINLSAERQGYVVDLRAQLGSEGYRTWLETQLFRGDGQLMEVIDYGLADAGTEMNSAMKLPSGSYWAVAVAHGKDEVQTKRVAFQIAPPNITLDLTLLDPQINLGESIQATITLTNQDPVNGTGILALSVKTLTGEGLQVWLPELGPNGSVTYDYSFTPETEGGYVLSTTVGGEMGTLARVDRAFVVGNAPAVALNILPQPTYPPGQDINWTVTASNAGTQSTTATVMLNTYDRDAGYAPVFNTSYSFIIGAGASTSFNLTTLPSAAPGAYSTHLALGGQQYRIDDYLVEAEGTLFASVQTEPTVASVAQSVTLTIEVQNETYTPIDANVTLNIRTPNGNVLNTPLTRVGAGQYRGTYIPSISGTYIVEVTASKPNYVGIASNSFFIADNASILLCDVEGRLILNEATSIIFKIYNERQLPVSGATVIVSGANGVVTGQTDQVGIISLLIRPVSTELVTIRIEKPGFANSNLKLSVESNSSDGTTRIYLPIILRN